jgi:hypothetical protein
MNLYVFLDKYEARYEVYADSYDEAYDIATSEEYADTEEVELLYELEEEE